MLVPIFAPAALAQGAADAAVPTVAIPFERYELANGLDVILAPDRSTPIVHVNVWYHVGSADEEAGRTGFAHLFEHLMFQGSPSAPGEYFDLLEEVGASVNGTTTFDRTNYFETVPSEYLPLALFVESDRMGWLLDTLDQQKLDNQREVVRNERRQRYENPPYGTVNIDLMAAVWPAAHPYHHVPIGSHQDLEAATLDDVKAFFARWYVPDNASLVIAGDFDPKKAKKLVALYFGGIPRSAGVAHAPPPAATVTPQTIVQYKAVPERKVWLAWTSPALFAPGDAEMDLLSHTLAEGKDSRLYYRLVKELRLAKDVSAYQQSLPRGSVYVITATAAEGHTTAEVVAEIDRVVASVLGDAPPTAEDLALARTQFEVGFYDRIASIAGKADALNSYVTYTGDPGYIDEDLGRYFTIGIDDVVRVGKTVLTGPRVELHVLPEADRPAEPPPPPVDAPAPEPPPTAPPTAPGVPK